MWFRIFLMVALLGLLGILAQALQEGEFGVCITTIRKTHPKTKKVPLKAKCPTKMEECPDRKKKEMKINPKTEKCCIEPSLVKKPACCDNFQFDPEKGVCIPQCNPPCIGGDCIGPNECKCPELLALDNLNRCYKPVCETDCFNSDCIANNTCKCTAGYEQLNSTHCRPNCEAGYINDFHNLECVPKCDYPCSNGNCTAPNTCTCKAGYKVLDGNTSNCIPICSPDCVNGNCSAPNTCSCSHLYTRDNDTHCSPICNRSCRNGVCTEPNKCKCNEGYEIDEDDEFVCNPICKDACEHQCIAPDLCRCNTGYEIDKHNHTKCVPICENKCLNGVCSLPNTCTCNENYEAGEDYWTCKLICACEHGICDPEGECICGSGYTIENGTCTSIASETVECSSCKTNCRDGKCWCEDGKICVNPPVSEPEKASTTGLAGFQLTWALLAALGILLIVLVLFVMHRLYNRKRVEDTVPKQALDPYGSVVCYNMPNTLLQRDPKDELNEADEEEVTETERIPMTQVVVKD